MKELAHERAAQSLDDLLLFGREVHLLEGAGDFVAPDLLCRVMATLERFTFTVVGTCCIKEMVAGAPLQKLKLAADLCPHPSSSLPYRAPYSANPGRGGSREIFTSSSTGGFFSWSRQPVAAKQRIRTSLPRTSTRRKFLKSGGSFQSKNSEK